jgi:NhaP-type Na+/H+ or K+/H+ antiporter
MIGSVVALTLSVIGRSYIERWEIVKLPVAGMMVIIGAASGGTMVWLGNAEEFEFDNDIFWDIFLPFILLEASMTIDKSLLKTSFGIVGLFAFCGTILNTALIGIFVWVGSMYLSENPLPFIAALLFGSIVAATDAISSVSVFKFFGVDPQLYILVVGETLLNDAVAVVLYLVCLRFSEMDTDAVDSESIMFAALTMLFNFFGSFALGTLLGAITNKALQLLKMDQYKQPLLETLTFMLFPLFGYYFGEFVSLSGIVTISICGIHLDMFARKQLSPMAQHHIHFVIEGAGMVFESITFIYMGAFMIIEHDKYWWDWQLCALAIVALIIARGLATIFLSGLWNAYGKCKDTHCNPSLRYGQLNAGNRTKTIPFNHQMVLWWSGLRGPLSFVLALSIPQENALSSSGNEHARLILAMTTFVIVSLTGILGSNMLPVLQCAGIQMERQIKTNKQGGQKLSAGGGRGVRNILFCGSRRFSGEDGEINPFLGMCSPGTKPSMCSSDIPQFNAYHFEEDDADSSEGGELGLDRSGDDEVFCQEVPTPLSKCRLKNLKNACIPPPAKNLSTAIYHHRAIK